MMNNRILKSLLLLLLLPSLNAVQAQQFPNNDFKKWDKEQGCPSSWYCNNDADCKGKVSIADKVKGGAKLTVMHCFDPRKDDRSNNVSLNYDELSANIPKGKKVRIIFTCSFTPVGNDRAYVKIDEDIEEDLPDGHAFFYNNNRDGLLKPGTFTEMVCTLSFDPEKAAGFTAPRNLTATSIRTSFGIYPAEGAEDVHKGSTLIIHQVKFQID